MPSESAAQDGGGAPGDQTVERVQALLSEALTIVDGLDLSPVIGARLQETISALEDLSGKRSR